jgi:hypothetical protein
MNCKSLSIGLILAVGLASGVAARQTTPRQTPPPSPQTKTTTHTPPKNGPMKLTGCIERGPAAGGSSTVVPPGNPPPPPMYKLTHVDPDMLKGMMADKAASATGTTSTEIGLRADSKLKLADHIDHKVELTGKMVAGKPDAKGATAQTAGITQVPIFEVTNLKMVGSTCQ